MSFVIEKECGEKRLSFVLKTFYGILFSFFKSTRDRLGQFIQPLNNRCAKNTNVLCLPVGTVARFVIFHRKPGPEHNCVLQTDLWAPRFITFCATP